MGCVSDADQVNWDLHQVTWCSLLLYGLFFKFVRFFFSAILFVFRCCFFLSGRINAMCISSFAMTFLVICLISNTTFDHSFLFLVCKVSSWDFDWKSQQTIKSKDALLSTKFTNLFIDKSIHINRFQLASVFNLLDVIVKVYLNTPFSQQLSLLPSIHCLHQLNGFSNGKIQIFCMRETKFQRHMTWSACLPYWLLYSGHICAFLLRTAIDTESMWWMRFAVSMCVTFHTKPGKLNSNPAKSRAARKLSVVNCGNTKYIYIFRTGFR